ncbi:cytochrome c oxidase subunit II [Halostagnicola kamekurae]
MNTIYSALPTPTPLQMGSGAGEMTRVDVFEEIFLVFLALGTLVGVLVVAYTLYNAYKYRDTGDRTDDENLPALGELPTGGGSGKKLFVSFALSAAVVIALIAWTYGMLLYVEDGPDELDEDSVQVDVQGQTFSWTYQYENGLEPGQLVVPAGEPVSLNVTSIDVWHTFGISQERVKADAIPGEHDETWFTADEAGTYEGAIECFELCGPGHSNMKSDLVVYEQDRYEEWVDEQFTLNITLQDGNEERVTSGVDELTLEHTEEDGHDYSYDGSEFENGSITINEIDQGGTYNLTITPEDDSEFEPIEEELDFTGPAEETYTLESPNASSEESGGNNGGDDTGSDQQGGEN